MGIWFISFFNYWIRGSWICCNKTIESDTLFYYLLQFSIMLVENLLPNILVSLIISPIVIVITYWLNNKWDYYQHLFNLIDEIEFNMKELNKFPDNFEKFLKADYSEEIWLPKTVTIKPVNLVTKESFIHKIRFFTYKATVDPPSYLINESGFLYSYFSDNAYVMFVNKGYPLIVQSKNGFIKSLFNDNYGENVVKGGKFEKISKFYHYCNEFNFFSQKIEEIIRQAKREKNDRKMELCSVDMKDLSEDSFDKIKKEYSGIGISELKNSRFNFFVWIFIIFIAIVAIFVIYIMSILNQENLVNNLITVYEIIQSKFFVS